MNLKRVAPIGTLRARGFVEYEDRSKSGLEEWDEPVYPDPCEEALKLRAIRRDSGLTLRAFANRIGIKPSEVCDLEGGRAVPESWDDVWSLITKEAS